MQTFLVLLVSIYVVTASDTKGQTSSPMPTLTPKSSTTPTPTSTLAHANTNANASPTPKPSPTPTPNPFSCDSSGTIKYIAPNWVRSASYSCGTESSLKAVEVRSLSIVLPGCMVNSSVHLIMYSMPSVSVKTAKLMLADGQQMEDVHLTCKAITFPKTFTVILDSKIGSTQRPLSVTESITLKMHLTNSNDTQAATVEIGKTYTLHISGAGIHFMKIKTCEAAATESMSSPVTIYDAETNSSNSIGILAGIMDDTSTTSDLHSIKASLTGFRLVTSRIVFLSCQIEVRTASRKRKRIQAQLKTASIRFEVKDKLLDRSANGAQGLFFTGKQIVTITMVVVTTYLFH